MRGWGYRSRERRGGSHYFAAEKAAQRLRERHRAGPASGCRSAVRQGAGGAPGGRRGGDSGTAVMYQDAPFAWSADYPRLPAPTVDQPTGSRP
jgi:hypothetical protein